ncbi:MAG: hypothetical protein ACTSUO_05525 [Candidatus Thorarchaeota archaeon]
MKDRKTAHFYAFMLALAMTGFVVGCGLPVVQATPYHTHAYRVPIRDAWFPILVFGEMILTTTSYSEGSDLGVVLASATSWSFLPLTIEVTGSSVTYIDSHRKVARGSYKAIAWAFWPLVPLQTNYYTLHKQVSYYGSGFSYSTWWT